MLFIKMVEDNKINTVNKDSEVKPTVQEVVKAQRQGKYIETKTEPTTFQEREKVEEEVTMIKVGRDASGRWLFKRSDRLTQEDKKKRMSMMEAIRKGFKV